MDRDVLRPNGRVFQFQRLGLSEKIPSVVVNNVGDLGFHCSRDLVCRLGGSK